MKRFLGFLIVVAFLLGALLPVYGNELEELRQQQRQIDREIRQHREAIKDKTRELKSLSEYMESLDRTIKAVESDLEDLGKQLSAAVGRVEKAEEELEVAENILQERTEVFRQRLVEIYHNGGVSYLEVLFDSTSMTDFLVRMELLQKIAEQDMELLDLIEAQKAEIEERKAQLEAERDEIARVKKLTEEKRARLASQQEEKAQLVEAIKTEKEAIERALAEEEEASRLLAAKIRDIQAKMSGDRKFAGGQLAWPTPGYSSISSDYGMRRHPILKRNTMHTGIDIRAPMGAKAVAAENGQVIFVGLFGAFGNVVVIDHGSKITTMYCHLSGFTVKEGEEVLRGDQIGKVGSTGLSTGPHLHFEVRKNGEPVNPWPYLK